MGKAPCCEKHGVKRGAWTPEEDQTLVDYIKENGHGSWRTLPKHAGALSHHFFFSYFFYHSLFPYFCKVGVLLCILFFFSFFESFEDREE